MNAIRVKHVRDFKGEDVVLLAMDGTGLATFLAALAQAERHGSGQLQRPRRLHDFVIEDGAAESSKTVQRTLSWLKIGWCGGWIAPLRSRSSRR